MRGPLRRYAEPGVGWMSTQWRGNLQPISRVTLRWRRSAEVMGDHYKAVQGLARAGGRTHRCRAEARAR
jgi:hypothetical protein